MQSFGKRGNLKKVPRADMDGFVPCKKDCQRLEKYNHRAQIELDNRKAILEGQRLYDKTFCQYDSRATK
jgi:hypothetical protein